jgi:hypothetical protein
MTVILLILQTETDTACVLLNERVAKEISATTDGISRIKKVEHRN